MTAKREKTINRPVYSISARAFEDQHVKRRTDPTRQQSLFMALGGASAKSASPATGMKRKTADEPTKKAKAKKDESEDSSRCV